MDLPIPTTEQEVISNILRSIKFDSMKQAKDIMRILVYEMKWPSVNDLLKLLNRPLLEYGDSYVWTNLQYDILSNKYGAAFRKDIKTKRSYFVLQLPVPEKIEK